MPRSKATLEGAPFRGANTPPALSAGIPPQRRITASGYSPYQAHVPRSKATLE
ncbi:hypothetical protein ACSEPO_03675 [Pseudomonas aeruginosa]